MLTDRIEGKWIDSFARTFTLSKVAPGDEIAILSETQSRSVNVHLAELALLRLGAKPFHVVMPTPPLVEPVPMRSTGASPVVQHNRAVMGALKAVPLIVDLTVEGMMHAPETPEILEGGTRLLYISNDHPEQLERCAPNPALRDKVHRGIGMAQAAREMRVTSRAGTDLTIDMTDAFVGGTWGASDTPGTIENWPGGIVVCFPRAKAVNGTLVLAEGDINNTFKRFLEKPVRMHFVDDFAQGIEGEGLDADLMREYLDAFGDRNAYGSSHVGWGMNPGARWESMIAYDKRDTNGVEQRAFAGNFLFSTGANPFADRFTLGHFDLPMRRCTVALDGVPVVIDGMLQAPLA